jgi:FemAB family protein
MSDFFDIPSLIYDNFTRFNLTTSPRSIRKSDWDILYANNPRCPIQYSHEYLDYQQEYFRFIDLSFIVYFDGFPTSIINLFILNSSNGVDKLSSSIEGIRRPLFDSNTSLKMIRKINSLFISTIGDLIEKYNLEPEPIVDDNLQDRHVSDFIIEVHKNLRIRKIISDFQLVYKFSESEDIYKNLSKNTKQNIRKAKQLWQIKIHEKISLKDFEEFRLLHSKVSGRKTRSDKSWQLQYIHINSGKAYLVAAYDQNDALVGGLYLLINKFEVMTGVGVYNRELFDKPIGHIIRLEAMIYAQNKGIRYFNNGFLELNSKNSKLFNISEFKRQFSNRLYLLNKYKI